VKTFISVTLSFSAVILLTSVRYAGISMRWRVAVLARVDALRSAPYLHLVAGFRQDVAAPNGSMVTDMFAAVHRYCFIPLDDTNFVIIHDVPPISGMGIERARDKGYSTN